MEVNDAIVEITESVHNYEEKEARDRKKKVIKSSMGVTYVGFGTYPLQDHGMKGSAIPERTKL